MEVPELKKLVPKGPTLLPVDKPKQQLRPAPSIMLETVKQWWSKTALRSRTIATGVVAIITFILSKILGLENVDFASVVDLADGLQVSEIGGMIVIVLMILFRKFLKTDLSTPGVGGANG